MGGEGGGGSEGWGGGGRELDNIGRFADNKWGWVWVYLAAELFGFEQKS